MHAIIRKMCCAARWQIHMLAASLHRRLARITGTEAETPDSFPETYLRLAYDCDPTRLDAPGRDPVREPTNLVCIKDWTTAIRGGRGRSPDSHRLPPLTTRLVGVGPAGSQSQRPVAARDGRRVLVYYYGSSSWACKNFCKRTVDSPSHRIFGRMHKTLNIDKNKTNYIV
jgi:hypothetical protein